MTHLMYLFCVAMYVLGQGLLLFWFTIPQLKEKCRIANKVFTLKEWWECDRTMVIGNMIFGAILVLGIDELVHWKPGVLDYIKWFFAIAGAFGPTIVQEKWGSFKKGISNLIDIKSNIADTLTGGTTTVKETITKGNEALPGADVTKAPSN